MYYDDESVFDDADVDNMPVFSESRRFSRLDSYEKMLLRDYIRSCIREHREYSGRFPTENELVEIRKRAISVLEDEWHITLKNDKQWRQFFQDNAKAAIAKLQKETEGNEFSSCFTFSASTTISQWKIFCSIRSSNVSATEPTNIPCVREEIFEGGMSESICVLMEVDLSLRLIVMLCRFCKTFPKRSESVLAVSPTT